MSPQAKPRLRAPKAQEPQTVQQAKRPAKTPPKRRAVPVLKPLYTDWAMI